VFCPDELYYPDNLKENCTSAAGNKMKMIVFVVLLISLMLAIAPLPSEALNVRGHLLSMLL
jgi:hypothetical protein